MSFLEHNVQKLLVNLETPRIIQQKSIIIIHGCSTLTNHFDMYNEDTLMSKLSQKNTKKQKIKNKKPT